MAYFLKKTTIKNREAKGKYLQIYEGHHDPEKGYAVHTSVRALGYVEELRQKGIEDPIAYGEAEVDRLNAEMRESKENIRKIGKSDERYVGYFAIKNVMNALNVKQFFNLMQLEYDIEYNVYDLFTALIYARITKPCSKLKTHEDVLPYLYEYNEEEWSYDQVLDCCEFIGKHLDNVTEILRVATDEVYGLNTERTYFDCTNFYFEIDKEDEWRRKGVSKENRHDPIIGMGLLLDRDQIPIGLKMYPGNESEKPKIRAIINELKERNNITGRTIQVADKGLNSAENIHKTLLEGDGYIFSKSVKKLSAVEKAWVFKEDDSTWHSVYEEDEDGNNVLKYSYKECVDTFEYNYEDKDGLIVTFLAKEKRIVTYNKSLAKKKIAELNKLKVKAMDLKLSQAKKKEYGECSKYVTFKAKGKNGEDSDDKVVATFNEKAFEEDVRIAGYNMIVTSEVNITATEIYKTYHTLWRIEESFRIMKSELDARPVYLQKPERIFGHFVICYTSVLLIRILELKILKDRVPAGQIIEFIRGFRIFNMPGQKIINITRKDRLFPGAKAVFNFPLDNYYLSAAELSKLFEKKLYAIDANGKRIK